MTLPPDSAHYLLLPQALFNSEDGEFPSGAQLREQNVVFFYSHGYNPTELEFIARYFDFVAADENHDLRISRGQGSKICDRDKIVHELSDVAQIILTRNDIDDAVRREVIGGLFWRPDRLITPVDIKALGITIEFAHDVLESKRYPYDTTCFHWAHKHLIATGFSVEDAERVALTLDSKSLLRNVSARTPELDVIKLRIETYRNRGNSLTPEEKAEYFLANALGAVRLSYKKGAVLGSEVFTIFRDSVNALNELEAMEQLEEIREFLNSRGTKKYPEHIEALKAILVERVPGLRDSSLQSSDRSRAKDAIVDVHLQRLDPVGTANSAVSVLSFNTEQGEYYLALLTFSTTKWGSQYIETVLRNLGNWERSSTNFESTLSATLDKITQHLLLNPDVEYRSIDIVDIVANEKGSLGVLARLADLGAVSLTDVWEKIVVPATGGNVVAGIDPTRESVLKVLKNMSPYADPESFGSILESPGLPSSLIISEPVRVLPDAHK